MDEGLLPVADELYSMPWIPGPNEKHGEPLYDKSYVVATHGRAVEYFQRDGNGDYTSERDGTNVAFEYDSTTGDEEMVYTWDSEFGQTETIAFYPWGMDNYQAGSLKYHVSGDGITTATLYDYDLDDTSTAKRLRELKRFVPDDPAVPTGDGVMSSVTVGYFSGETWNDPRAIKYAVLRRADGQDVQSDFPDAGESQAWSGADHSVRRARYYYYETPSDLQGNIGDLKFVAIQRPSPVGGVVDDDNDAHWETVEVTYFRYHDVNISVSETNTKSVEFAGKLKSVLEPAWYSRLAGVNSKTNFGDMETYLNVASDATLADYVTYLFDSDLYSGSRGSSEYTAGSGHKEPHAYVCKAGCGTAGVSNDVKSWQRLSAVAMIRTRMTISISGSSGMPLR